MALLSKSEFAKKCFIKGKILAIYIARNTGKIRVICRDDGLIDENEPVNVFFYNRRFVYAEKKGISQTFEPIYNEKIPEIKPQTQVKTPISRQKIESVDEKRALLYEQDRLAIQLKNEKLEAEILKIRLTNQKSMGDFAKVDQVQVLFGIYSNALNESYEAIFDDYVHRIAAKYQLNRDEITKFKVEKNNSINRARERAIKIAKENLKKAQLEISEQKGIGDHQ